MVGEEEGDEGRVLGVEGEGGKVGGVDGGGFGNFANSM